MVTFPEGQAPPTAKLDFAANKVNVKSATVLKIFDIKSTSPYPEVTSVCVYVELRRTVPLTRIIVNSQIGFSGQANTPGEASRERTLNNRRANRFIGREVQLYIPQIIAQVM